MSFKRYLFLAACVLLFIVGFIAYFTISRVEMDNHFREEREKFNVQGVTLTSPSSPTVPAPALPAISSSGTTSAPTPDASTPSVSPAPTTTDSTASPASSATPAATDSPAPAMNPAATDPNIIIGPVPPPPSTPAPAPDSSTNAAPAPTDSTTAPMAPSSTMNDTRQSLAPFLVRAAYHPMAQSPTNDLVRPGTPNPTEPSPHILGVNTVEGSTSTNATPSKPAATNGEATTAPVTNSSSTNIPPALTGGHATGVEASVIVLLYHQFTPSNVHAPAKFQWTMNVDVFASEMKYIHDNGYHVIPMSDLIKFLHHEIGLPPNSVVITIDDGYKSAIVHAAPILKQYGYPWTFFVYPEFITVNEGSGAASWNDLLALQADGVDIESHSMTHPTLTKHTQKWKGSVHTLSAEEYDEWLTNETLGSKTLLEQKMGKPILCFAYPYGAYNKEVEAKAIAAGYQYIFTVADNPVHGTTNPHSIGRYTITQGVEKDFAAYLRQGALGVADADPAPGGTTTNPRPVITAVLGYAGTLDPNSIETSVRDFGIVKHDFDPKTSTIRLYLPRDLIQPVNLVNIRVKDAQTGQVMVANWHFNFEPAGGTGTHAPIAPATNSAPESTNAPAASSSETPLSAGTNSAPTATNSAPSTNTPPAKPANSASPASSKAHQD